MKFGPGTVTITWDGDTPTSIECEVTGGGVGHNYDTVSQATRLCDTTKRPDRLVRAGDTLSLDVTPDFDGPSVYSAFHEHDLEDAQIVFTPNTATGASWAGTVTTQLPSEVSAAEWGEDFTGTIELQSTSTFVFTPAGP